MNIIKKLMDSGKGLVRDFSGSLLADRVSAAIDNNKNVSIGGVAAEALKRKFGGFGKTDEVLAEGAFVLLLNMYYTPELIEALAEKKAAKSKLEAAKKDWENKKSESQKAKEAAENANDKNKATAEKKAEKAKDEVVKAEQSVKSAEKETTDSEAKVAKEEVKAKKIKAEWTVAVEELRKILDKIFEENYGDQNTFRNFVGFRDSVLPGWLQERYGQERGNFDGATFLKQLVGKDADYIKIVLEQSGCLTNFPEKFENFKKNVKAFIGKDNIGAFASRLAEGRDERKAKIAAFRKKNKK